MRRDAAPLVVEIRATLALATPLVGANLAQMTMQVTNIVMVGHVGPTALAAAGLGSSIFATLLMICQGVLSAVTPLAAHAIGADDHLAAGRIAGAGLIIAAVLVVPVMAVFTLAPALFIHVGYAPGLASEIGRFLRVARWAAPAFLASSVLRYMLIAAFRGRVVLIVPLIAVPVNGLVAWVLIFGHLGAPPLGVVGAASASVSVQWLMLGCFSGYLLVARVRVPLRLARRFVADIGRIMRLGAPIGALLGLEVGLFMTTGVLMGLLGADALAAHQVVFNVAGITFMVPLGLGQAATARVAFRLGGGEPAAARRAAFVALALGTGFMGAASVVLATVPSLIGGLYVDAANPANAGVLAIAVELFMIEAAAQVFDGAQVIAVGALRGYHDTAVPMLIAAIGYWAVGFAGGWLLAFPLGLGPVGLWLGLALGLAVVATAVTLRLNCQASAHIAASTAGLQPPVASAMSPP